MMDTLGSQPDHHDQQDKKKRIFAIVGASSGNLVEWFDFYVYSFCSLYFASSFFPSGNSTTQLLQTAGVFAAGFFMRPIGGWLFGYIADKHGRKNSMMIFGLHDVLRFTGHRLFAYLRDDRQLGTHLIAHRPSVSGAFCRWGIRHQCHVYE
ncbi:Major facilitator superfamily (MFS) profile domain-containing protein [Rahnella victoriana]